MIHEQRAARPVWFAFAAASWMLFGTLLLVLMTAWNGVPLPAVVPTQGWPLTGFILVVAFVYLLPVWLVLRDRHFAQVVGERPSYAAYAGVTAALGLLWALLLL